MSKHMKDYTTTFTVNVSASEAFKNINNVTGWWTENLKGQSEKLNDVFTVQFDDIHVSTQTLIEVVPDKKIVWLVSDSNLNFIEDKQEWNNTTISFEIREKNGTTEVQFTHHGLVPEVECFDACSNAWSEYIQGSLLPLIATGKGKPTKKSVVAR
jgi:hypothetical protein